LRFNIITNLTVGCGLYHDYATVRARLEAQGHAVTGIDFQSPQRIPADVNIFIETVVPSLFGCAKKQVYIVNPEWHVANTDSFDFVLCKTRYAHALLTAVVGDRARYLGFESRDLYRADVPRETKFIHVAGKSALKNTLAVLEAWRDIPYPLTLVTVLHNESYVARDIANVTVRNYVSDEELAQLMNSHRFHLCPSATEGFGHYSHEATGCGAVTLLSDAPPMNEFVGLKIPARANGTLRLSTLYSVASSDVRKAVMHAVQLPEEDIADISAQARQSFLSNRAEFRQRFAEVMKEVTA
jgi:hypothetical protein